MDVEWLVLLQIRNKTKEISICLMPNTNDKKSWYGFFAPPLSGRDLSATQYTDSTLSISFPFFCTFPIHSLRMKTIHTFLLLIICLSNDVRKMTKYHKLYNLQINFPTSFLRSSKKNTKVCYISIFFKVITLDFFRNLFSLFRMIRES